MTDRFQAHIGVVVIALVALVSTAAIVWQVVHSHDVDPLLSGLALGTIGVLTPTPTSKQSVTVDNASSDPVPVAPTPDPADVPLVEPARKTRRRVDKGHADPFVVVGVVLIVLLLLVVVHVL